MDTRSLRDVWSLQPSLSLWSSPEAETRNVFICLQGQKFQSSLQPREEDREVGSSCGEQGVKLSLSLSLLIFIFRHGGPVPLPRGLGRPLFWRGFGSKFVCVWCVLHGCMPCKRKRDRERREDGDDAEAPGSFFFHPSKKNPSLFPRWPIPVLLLEKRRSSSPAFSFSPGRLLSFSLIGWREFLSFLWGPHCMPDWHKYKEVYIHCLDSPSLFLVAVLCLFFSLSNSVVPSVLVDASSSCCFLSGRRTKQKEERKTDS